MARLPAGNFSSGSIWAGPPRGCRANSNRKEIPVSTDQRENLDASPPGGKPTRDRERKEFDMSDWNAKTIAEFRANEGSVGGIFEDAPMVLLHHRGRKSAREYVTPTMYLPHDT